MPNYISKKYYYFETSLCIETLLHREGEGCEKKRNLILLCFSKNVCLPKNNALKQQSSMISEYELVNRWYKLVPYQHHLMQGIQVYIRNIVLKYLKHCMCHNIKSPIYNAKLAGPRMNKNQKTWFRSTALLISAVC